MNPCLLFKVLNYFLKIRRVSALNGVLQFLTDFFMIRTSYKSLCDQILTYLFMVHMLLAYNCDQLLPSQCVNFAARLMMFFFMASALVLNHLCFESLKLKMFIIFCFGESYLPIRPLTD